MCATDVPKSGIATSIFADVCVCCRYLNLSTHHCPAAKAKNTYWSITKQKYIPLLCIRCSRVLAETSLQITTAGVVQHCFGPLLANNCPTWTLKCTFLHPTRHLHPRPHRQSSGSVITLYTCVLVVSVGGYITPTCKVSQTAS